MRSVTISCGEEIPQPRADEILWSLDHDNHTCSSYYYFSKDEDFAGSNEEKKLIRDAYRKQKLAERYAE